MKWLGLISMLVSFSLFAETNSGVFSEIKVQCKANEGNQIDCSVNVLVNSVTHPDYFEEVTHLVIVENKDCSKAVYNDILYFTQVEEGQNYKIVKTYSSEVETWFSACLFMEEELVESLPVKAYY